MLRLKDLMQRDVVSVSPDLTLRALLEILGEHQVSGAPVVAAGKVVGVISTTDIFDFREESADEGPTSGSAPRSKGTEFFSEMMEPAEIDAVEWMRETRAGDWDILDQYSVADVMTREIVSQPSAASVKDAAAYMLDAGVRRVLVIDEGKLQGIVTATDIVRAVANGAFKG